ncbi:MAG: precorrin-2 C(20)-methyltransferase [Lentisphaerales bacterium]|nr:precorrin-2 C(20)-methyltransferase [Lentisphaerales bacterium]
MSQFGKLYGVGVGTGSPDLMTLRAVNVLREVDVIVIPQSKKGRKSVAWRITEPNVVKNDAQERLFLTFPMTKDPEILKPAWDIAFTEIGKRLEEGKNVAFITEGDPLFFSTYIYLHKAAQKRWPEVETEIVPAVSSFTAVPSVIQQPIADGQERVAVVPASYGLDTLPQILQLFDTVLLMKVSSIMPRLVEILKNEGLLDCATYVSKATMDFQMTTTDLEAIKNDKCDYFSMVMVKKQDRNGILEGRFKESTES